MDIVKVKLNELTEASYNPRVTLTPEMDEYKKLKRSIEEFGYVEPLVVNKRNNVVIGGHQRLSVLHDLGYDVAECVYVDLNENDEKALNLALNKINGEWDNVKLNEILNQLKVEDYDITLTGFDDLSELETDLPDNLDDYFRELDEQEEKKRNKIYIQIGKKIKIEINESELDKIDETYRKIGDVKFKELLGCDIQ